MLQSVTMEDTRQRNLPRCSHSNIAKQTKRSEKAPHHHKIFYFSVISLIQGRKTKQRRKPLFSTKGSEEERKKRKAGYTILFFFHCRRSQQIKSTRLQTHSSKATFLSLCPGGQAERRDKRAGEERKQIRRKKFTETHKIKTQHSHFVCLFVFL